MKKSNWVKILGEVAIMAMNVAIVTDDTFNTWVIYQLKSAG